MHQPHGPVIDLTNMLMGRVAPEPGKAVTLYNESEAAEFTTSAIPREVGDPLVRWLYLFAPLANAEEVVWGGEYVEAVLASQHGWPIEPNEGLILQSEGVELIDTRLIYVDVITTGDALQFVGSIHSLSIGLPDAEMSIRTFPGIVRR